MKGNKAVVQHPEAGCSRWSGKVKHRLGDSTVELFYLSALIPADTAEQMPTTLFVTELAPVRAICKHCTSISERCCCPAPCGTVLSGFEVALFARAAHEALLGSTCGR